MLLPGKKRARLMPPDSRTHEKITPEAGKSSCCAVTGYCLMIYSSSFFSRFHFFPFFLSLILHFLFIFHFFFSLFSFTCICLFCVPCVVSPCNRIIVLAVGRLLSWFPTFLRVLYTVTVACVPINKTFCKDFIDGFRFRRILFSGGRSIRSPLLKARGREEILLWTNSRRDAVSTAEEIRKPFPIEGPRKYFTDTCCFVLIARAVCWGWWGGISTG